jgi:hypothetical protein
MPFPANGHHLEQHRSCGPSTLLRGPDWGEWQLKTGGEFLEWKMGIRRRDDLVWPSASSIELPIFHAATKLVFNPATRFSRNKYR